MCVEIDFMATNYTYVYMIVIMIIVLTVAHLYVFAHSLLYSTSILMTSLGVFPNRAILFLLLLCCGVSLL